MTAKTFMVSTRAAPSPTAALAGADDEDTAHGGASEFAGIAARRGAGTTVEDVEALVGSSSAGGDAERGCAGTLVADVEALEDSSNADGDAAR